MGDKNKALADLNDADRQQPERSSTLSRAGLLLHPALAKFDKALGGFQRIGSNDAKVKPKHMSIAQHAFYLMKEFGKRALRIVTRPFVWTRKNAIAYTTRDRSVGRRPVRRNGPWQIAIFAIKIDPKGFGAYYVRALIHGGKREFDLALRDWGKYIELTPGSQRDTRCVHRLSIDRRYGQSPRR